MHKVNFDEVMRALTFQSEVNALPLEEIEWVRDDGSVVKVDPKIIEDWKFVGLSNFCFVEINLTRIAEGKEDEVLKELEWQEVK